VKFAIKILRSRYNGKYFFDYARYGAVHLIGLS